MTVAGRPVVHDDTFAVRNPATGDVVGYAPECPPAELDRALGAAASAAAGWADDLLARRAGLREGARALRASVEELATLLTDEQGKPLADARMELEWAAACLDYYAGLDLRGGGGPGRRNGPCGAHPSTHRDRGGDHAVELSRDHGGLQAGARAGCRQHGGAEALSLYPVDHAAAGGPARRDASRRGDQRDLGQRRRRPPSGRRSEGPQGHPDRLDHHGPRGGSGRRTRSQAGHARARWQRRRGHPR